MPPEQDSKPAVNIWYLRRFLKPYTSAVVLTMVFLLAGRVAASLDPIWLKYVIDGVSKHDSFSIILPTVIIFFALRLGSAVFDFLRDLVFSPAEMGIARTLSDKLFDHLLHLPIQYHVDQKIGGLTRKITRGGRSITMILDFLVINIIPTVVQLIIVTFLLLRLYSPIYATITIGTIAVYGWFTIWATDKRQKYRLGANLADDEVASVEVDGLANIETVKYFNNENVLLDRYHPATIKRYMLGVTSNQLFALISGVQGLIIVIGLSALFFLALKEVNAGTMSVGDLVLLTTYITQLSSPINMLGFVYRQIKDGLADLDGLARILIEGNPVSEPENPTVITKPKGTILFSGVHFGYPGKREVLRGVDIRIDAGERVAFVGPSGVGKSTIVKLLFRFYDPKSGSITIDGIDLKELDKVSRRRIFAIVPQEPILFHSSIGENIRFGKPDATQEEVEEAARLANLYDLVENLPDKYDTIVGERGVKLSGGEKQRVAIARAIIRDPRILVFDEATSSLDSHSEREILSALKRVSEGRTTVAVAHRLSTIVDSDRIFVLSKGDIAEQGTHTELLALGGIYARLWKIQASGGKG